MRSRCELDCSLVAEIQKFGIHWRIILFTKKLYVGAQVGQERCLNTEETDIFDNTGTKIKAASSVSGAEPM